MKTKAFVLVALSSVTMLSAAPSQQSQNTYQYQKSDQDPATKQTPRTIMDDEIAKNVHSAIAPTWLSNGYANVTFDVNNGTVNLRGFVDTKEEKTKLEQSIKKIEGVKTVNSEVTVGLPKAVALNDTKAKNGGAATITPTSSTSAANPKDSAANDKDRLINSKIREKVSKWSPKGYETIVIATSNGVVTISGNVERVEDIQKISNDAKSVDGVKSITNQISVKKR